MKKSKQKELLTNLPNEFWIKNLGVPAYRLAKELSIYSGLITQFRKSLGLNSDEVLFNNRHGGDSFTFLCLMLKDPLISLKDVGDYFGFTREYARLLFLKIYKISYGECFPRVRKQLDSRFMKNIFDIYVQAQGILIEHGFKSVIVKCKNSYRLQVFGDILAAKRLYVNDGFIFSTQKSAGEIDFYICFNLRYERVYIIPSREMPKFGLRLSLSGAPSKYDRFLNNFDAIR